MRARCLVLTVTLLAPARADAEWQIKPFVATTFGGGTTFVEVENAAGRFKQGFGVSGVLIGEVIGIEADFGHTPGFFQRGEQEAIFKSGTTTTTWNIVIAAPRRLAEYSLRPYAAAGAGFMHARIDPCNAPCSAENVVAILRVSRNLPALDFGGGVTGFLTDRFGVSWDVRYFRSIDRSGPGTGLSVGGERLSFWRASMALVVRFK